MTYYEEQKKAFIELNALIDEPTFNDDEAVFRLTLKYEISELCLRKRLALIHKIRGK